jgi:hypothetical protein
MSETSPNRLSFNEAVAYVEQTGKAAFAAMPVFGDDEGDENATAEGARVFLLLPDADERLDPALHRRAVLFRRLCRQRHHPRRRDSRPRARAAVHADALR